MTTVETENGSLDYHEMANGLNIVIKRYGLVYAGAVFAAHGQRPHKWIRSRSMFSLRKELREIAAKTALDTLLVKKDLATCSWLNPHVKFGMNPANALRPLDRYIVLENSPENGRWHIEWKTTDLEGALIQLKRISIENATLRRKRRA